MLAPCICGMAFKKMNHINWHIGCSGFHYKEWKDEFYKGVPGSKWFAFYSSRINALESNVSFYRFPSISMLQNWYNTSPPGFTLAVKAPRSITHYRKFKECRQLLEDFYLVIKTGLQEKLGCVLFQLPPGYQYNSDRLNDIIQILDPAFTNVLEFRHESWWCDEVYKVLSEKNIVFCGQSHPGLPHTPICNQRTAYYRFHGSPELYKSPYSHEFLSGIVDEIAQCNKVKEAYLFFNNTMTVAAIEHVRFLQQKLIR